MRSRPSHRDRLRRVRVALAEPAQTPLALAELAVGQHRAVVRRVAHLGVDSSSSGPRRRLRTRLRRQVGLVLAGRLRPRSRSRNAGQLHRHLVDRRRGDHQDPEGREQQEQRHDDVRRAEQVEQEARDDVPDGAAAGLRGRWRRRRPAAGCRRRCGRRRAHRSRAPPSRRPDGRPGRWSRGRAGCASRSRPASAGRASRPCRTSRPRPCGSPPSGRRAAATRRRRRRRRRGRTGTARRRRGGARARGRGPSCRSGARWRRRRGRCPSQIAATPRPSAANRRSTGPRPERTARGAGRRDVRLAGSLLRRTPGSRGAVLRPSTTARTIERMQPCFANPAGKTYGSPC